MNGWAGSYNQKISTKIKNSRLNVTDYKWPELNLHVEKEDKIIQWWIEEHVITGHGWTSIFSCQGNFSGTILHWNVTASSKSLQEKTMLFLFATVCTLQWVARAALQWWVQQWDLPLHEKHPPPPPPSWHCRPQPWAAPAEWSQTGSAWAVCCKRWCCWTPPGPLGVHNPRTHPERLPAEEQTLRIQTACWGPTDNDKLNVPPEEINEADVARSFGMSAFVNVWVSFLLKYGIVCVLMDG